MDTAANAAADINLQVGSFIVARGRNLGNVGYGGVCTISAVVPNGTSYVINYIDYGGSPTITIYELTN